MGKVDKKYLPAQAATRGQNQNRSFLALAPPIPASFNQQRDNDIGSRTLAEAALKGDTTEKAMMMDNDEKKPAAKTGSRGAGAGNQDNKKMSGAIHESKEDGEESFLAAKQRKSGGTARRRGIQKTKPPASDASPPGAVLIPGNDNGHAASYINALQEDDIDEYDRDDDDNGIVDDDAGTFIVAAQVVNDDNDENLDVEKIQQEVESRLKMHNQTLAFVDAVVAVRPPSNDAYVKREQKMFGLTRKMWCLMLVLVLLIIGIVAGVLVSSKSDSPETQITMVYYDAEVLATLCSAPTLSDELNAICMLDSNLTNVQSGLNVFFLLSSGTLVFLMQTGFAMLCAGSIRQKNVKNILCKNLLDACGGALGFWAIGYAFAYGGTTSDVTFIGTSNFFLRDNSTGPEYISFFFQFAFAATAATIVAGTVAERCKMQAYLFYSVFLTGFVYPVIVHSIWSGNGFLTAFRDDPFRGVGVIDFAGSGVVHMTGGATALVAAIVLGPRKGRFYDEDGNPLEIPVTFQAHSVALQILGTFVLWVGWYGFNPGSALIIDNPSSTTTSALAAISTTLAGASGAITALFFDSLMEMLSSGEVSYDLTMAMNGCLGGLVGVTAGCAVVAPWAAVIIGMVAALVYVFFSKLLIKLKIDDAVDAIPVHFGCGMWGIIAVGFFAEASHMANAGYTTEHEGWFFSLAKGSTDANLLLAQFCGLCWICGWVFGVMTPFFLVLNYFGMFRVDALEEEVGLDISHHRGAAYDLSAPKKEDVEELMEVRASRH